MITAQRGHHQQKKQSTAHFDSAEHLCEEKAMGKVLNEHCAENACAGYSLTPNKLSIILLLKKLITYFTVLVPKLIFR